MGQVQLEPKSLYICALTAQYHRQRPIINDIPGYEPYTNIDKQIPIRSYIYSLMYSEDPTLAAVPRIYVPFGLR